MDKHTKNSAMRKTRARRGIGNRRPTARRKAAARLAIGVDLGNRYSEVCVLEDGDMVHSEGRIRTTKAAMREFFERLAPARVAIETGTHSGWVSRLLTVCGHEVVVANARELRKIHQNNHKNDRADARILARMVRFDPQLLSPIKHRSAEMQADTALLRTREALVSTRARFTNTARGLVKASGGRLPACSTASFSRQVRGQIPVELQAALKPLVAMVEALNHQIRACDEQIAALAKNAIRSQCCSNRLPALAPSRPSASCSRCRTSTDSSAVATSGHTWAWYRAKPTRESVHRNWDYEGRQSVHASFAGRQRPVRLGPVRARHRSAPSWDAPRATLIYWRMQAPICVSNWFLVRTLPFTSPRSRF